MTHDYKRHGTITILVRSARRADRRPGRSPRPTRPMARYAKAPVISEFIRFLNRINRRWRNHAKPVCAGPVRARLTMRRCNYCHAHRALDIPSRSRARSKAWDWPAIGTRSPPHAFHARTSKASWLNPVAPRSACRLRSMARRTRDHSAKTHPIEAYSSLSIADLQMAINDYLAISTTPDDAHSLRLRPSSADIPSIR